jgi:hypothetical protein
MSSMRFLKRTTAINMMSHSNPDELHQRGVLSYVCGQIHLAEEGEGFSFPQRAGLNCPVPSCRADGSIQTGIRGMPPSDIDAIKDCMLRLSQLVSEHPEIDELDINPLIVYAKGEGCVVADCRIVLSKVPERPSLVDELE